MKILNIKIENIASLKGSHFIDFESFGDNNSVFAITGETGSGKSTILNAISLSLYGQNYKKNLNQLDFITLGESEGLIELQFKINKTTYRANWSCRLKKSNGEDLKTPKPKRDLYEREENKWVAKEYLPEEIINLNFDQFCKTMILNQGEFSKFLTSSFKERKDILERFYDGEKLELLSLRTRQKINKINQDIENLTYQIAGLTEHSQINEDDTKEKIALNESKIKNYKRHNLFLTGSSDKMKEILGLSGDLKTNTDRITRMSIDIKELTSSKNKLIEENESIEKGLKNYNLNFIKQEPLLIQCRDIFNTNKVLEEENKKNSNELMENIKNLNNESDLHLVTKKENKILEAKLISNKSNKFFLDIDSKNLQELIKLETNRKEMKSDLKLIISEFKIIEKSLKEIESEANSIKTKNKRYEEFIKSNPVLAVEKELIQIEERKNSFLKAQNDFKNIRERLIDLNQTIKEDTSQKDNYLKSIKELTIKLELLNDRKIENEAALKYYKLSESIEICKHESIKTGNCVICKTDIKEFEFEDINNISNDNYLKTISAKDVIEKEIQNINDSILKEETNSNSKEVNINTNKKKRKNLIEDFQKDLINKLAIKIETKEILSEEVLDTRLLKISEETKSEILVLTKKKEHIYETVYKNESAIKDLVQLREKYKKQSDQLNTLELSINDLNSKLSPIINNITSLMNHKTINENLMESLLFTKDHINDENNRNKINIDLSIQVERIKKLEKEISTKKNYLTKMKLEIEKNNKYINKMIQDKDPDIELKSLKSQKIEIDENLKRSRNNLKQSEITLAQKSSQLKGYHEQIEHIKNQLNISFKEIKDLIRDTSEIKIDENLNEEEKTLLEDYQRFIRKIKDTNHLENVETELLTETFQFNLNLTDRFKSSIDKKNSIVTEHKTLLKEKSRSLKKVNEINKEIKSRESERSELEDLYSLVGRDEFRNYVLSIIEKRLIAQTNNEIKQLCDDRYKIIHLSKLNKMAPDFYVIDRYKAGLTRKISTLSGGETFMVSLAMAMALSELSRGTNEIDSFFIDEGFGTLDDDSLEDVLEMINNIQARGKSIGLITHVKKLADRIPINIQLDKSELGNSTINIRFQ